MKEMALCRNCRNEIADDSSYCINCGTQQNGAGPSGGGTGRSFRLDDLIAVVVTVITKPVSSIRAVSDIDTSTWAILGGIIAVIQGFVGIWVVSRIGSIVESAITDLVGNLGQILMGSLGRGSLLDYADISWVSIYFFSMLLSVVIMLGLSLGLFLAGKYFLKSNAGNNRYINVAIGSQIPVVVAMVVGLIISLITVPLGIMVFRVGAIVSIVYAFFGLEQITGVEKDKLIYALPLAYVVMYLIGYIFTGIYISM